MPLEQSARHNLTPLDEALSLMLNRLSPQVEVRECRLDEALGMVLAQEQIAPFDVPAEDYSAMDGYAVRAAEIQADVRYTISHIVSAGELPQALPVGTVARIATGAALPAGSDAVIPQEQARTHGTHGTKVQFNAGVHPGEHIRRAGEDFTRATSVLPRGRRLRPHDLGILASLGKETVPVYRALRIGIASTGEELLSAGASHKQGRRYDTNRHVLMALVRKLGMESVDGGVLGPHRQMLESQIQALAQNVDCLITSGGVSVGTHDHTRSVIEQIGELYLWRVALKPGKPFAFGSIAEVPVFALPGNPASALIGFYLLIRPCLLKMQACSEVAPATFGVRAMFAYPADARQQILRAHVVRDESGALVAHAERAQSSGTLGAFARCNALLTISAGRAVAVGNELDAWWLESFY